MSCGAPILHTTVRWAELGETGGLRMSRENAQRVLYAVEHDLAYWSGKLVEGDGQDDAVLLAIVNAVNDLGQAAQHIRPGFRVQVLPLSVRRPGPTDVPCDVDAEGFCDWHCRPSEQCRLEARRVRRMMTCGP